MLVSTGQSFKKQVSAKYFSNFIKGKNIANVCFKALMVTNTAKPIKASHGNKIFGGFESNY
jgi:hypothetical protein